MIQKLQPVRPRHRQADSFQGADHRVEETARTAPHQHENILRLDCPPHPGSIMSLHPDRLVPVNHALDFCREMLRQLRLG